VSGTRESDVIAWLPQKFIARNTGAGTGRLFGTTSIRSINGPPPPASSEMSFRVALPSRKSRCTARVFAAIFTGFGIAPYM
jgi:hypothetical protein